MTLIRGSRTRRLPGMAAAAFLAVLLPAGLATAASAAGGRVAASSASCPWLNQSLPARQRVQMLLAKMTLADKINMVTGAGTSEPYVFYIAAIPSLCIPAMGEEDGPVGVVGHEVSVGAHHRAEMVPGARRNLGDRGQRHDEGRRYGLCLS